MIPESILSDLSSAFCDPTFSIYIRAISSDNVEIAIFKESPGSLKISDTYSISYNDLICDGERLFASEEILDNGWTKVRCSLEHKNSMCFIYICTSYFRKADSYDVFSLPSNVSPDIIDGVLYAGTAPILAGDFYVGV